MDSKKQLSIYSPLFIYIPRGDNVAQSGRRLRPDDALDLASMIRQLKRDAIYTVDIEEGEWSVLSVQSPYSNDIHVMVMETSPNRYLPTPEKLLSIVEGVGVMRLLAVLVNYLIIPHNKIDDICNNSTIHMGYTWSPRSWGKGEEITGFQSIPTKWHAIVWRWPPKDEQFNGNGWKWLDWLQLREDEQRVLGSNRYALPIGQAIVSRISKAVDKGLFAKWFNSAIIDSHCIKFPLRCPLMDVLGAQCFYESMFAPIARAIATSLEELTEALTNMNCKDIDSLLEQTAHGPLSTEDRSTLRKDPEPRSEADARLKVAAAGFGDDVFDAIWESVLMRCSQSGGLENHTKWWRKGFGYSLTLSHVCCGYGNLRILIGCYQGCGGPVESLGLVLRRPDNLFISDEDALIRSKLLWQLGDAVSVAKI